MSLGAATSPASWYMLPQMQTQPWVVDQLLQRCSAGRIGRDLMKVGALKLALCCKGLLRWGLASDSSFLLPVFTTVFVQETLIPWSQLCQIPSNEWPLTGFHFFKNQNPLLIFLFPWNSTFLGKVFSWEQQWWVGITTPVPVASEAVSCWAMGTL